MNRDELENYYQNNQDKIEAEFEEYIEEMETRGFKRKELDTDKKFWEFVNERRSNNSN